MSQTITIRAAVVVEEILHDIANRMCLPDWVGGVELGLYNGSLSGMRSVPKSWIENEINDTLDLAVLHIRID